MKNIQKYTTVLFAALLVLSSCTKEFDDPTVKAIPVGDVLTIAQVRALYVPGTETRITQDISVFGVVTADETTGNLYKETYIQDETGALYLRFTTSSGVYIGDSIRVNLKGTKLLKFNKMLQVDSVHPDNNIVKLATQHYRKPQLVTISQLLADIEGFQGKLIQLDNVYFTEYGQGLTYADGVNKVDISRFLEDFSSTQVEVRTSGYANFANDTLAGLGTFIGISAQYNSGIQLTIRNPNELNMTNAAPIIKNFNDGSLTSGGWTTQLVTGPTFTAWNIFSSSNSAAKISCYNATTMSGEISEAWLISPTLNLLSSTSPSINFRNVIRFGSTPQLKVMISVNYNGTGNPNTATWVDVTNQATWDTDVSSWSTWTNSGDINLTPYISGNTHVAFQYIGINAAGVSTWEIDDIKILK